MSETTIRGDGPSWLRPPPAGRDVEVTALAIAWSAAEPGRVGEVALFEDGGPQQILGRGAPQVDDPFQKVAFWRHRPDRLDATPPIEGPGISRHQLAIRPGKGVLEVERTGRCPMLVDGQVLTSATLRPGDTLMLKNQLLLVCVRRRAELPSLRAYPPRAMHAFGSVDPFGMVGESPLLWKLRDDLAFAAQSENHVLVLGESGTGKELAARCLHALSARAHGPLVSRSAATVPSGIIDAELFGNVKNYPNAGMPERPGLVGEADRGTLLLDEIGELPLELQAHLLRVLDAGGEYQRLGDAKPRRADFRLVAATNRPLSSLKHDLVGRLTVRVTTPGLDERREDVPLLVRCLLLRAAEKTPALGQRFVQPGDGGAGEPRVDPDLLALLLRHRFTLHVRELDALLWQAIAGSEADYVALSGQVREAIEEAEAAEATAEADGEPVRDPGQPEPTKEEIVAALEHSGGKPSKAYRELGLSSRHALYRLMKKHDLVGSGSGE